MATENIKIGIDVVSNTDVETTKAVKLRKAYEDAGRAAGSVGGTAGSRAVAAKAAPKSSGISGEEYGTAQGVTGMGSGARDFAKEAQGLGGLVRVYATFAANIFAVSAAFTALREAAATENIVKGLDQLGTASGRSLGSLSKQLVAASDGAISLRDSMTAVAQASSANLSNKQILELGDVAKKASESLGLSMPDALSRLSRGITKIEPELLDELGIFVKVDEASQKYALSVGKTVASLSDLEKRQAFANAVLQQGKEKFAAIEGAANPFDKLLASISNLATAGLSLLNTFFGPIAKFLSESPVALSLVFAGIATILLKQAIPALGEFRKGLEASAQQALKSAEVFKSSFGDKFQNILEQRFKIPDLSSDITKMEKDLAKIKMPAGLTKAESLSKLSSATEADPAALKSVNDLLKRRNDIIETGMKGSKAATEQQLADAKSERDVIQKTIALYQKRLELTAAQTGLQEQADKQGRFHPETIALEKYTKLKTKVDQATAVSNAAQNAGIVGVRQSWALLNQEIEQKGIKGFDKFTTQVKGGSAAVLERLGGIVSKFGYIGEIVGGVVAIYALFDSALSKATKQQEELNAKIDQNREAVSKVNDVFTMYTEKKKNAFGIEGIVAFTNALSQVADSFDAQLDALIEFRKAAGVWDQLKDDVAGIFGKSNTDNIRKNAVSSVQAIIKSLEFSSGGDAAKQGIAGILNLQPEQLNDINALKKATKDLDEVSLGKLAKEFKVIEEREQFSTNAAKAFMESLTSIDKLVDQLIQANAFTDLQGKIGVELVNAADRLGQALSDPLKALTDIAAIGKDPKMLAIIGKDDLNYLVQAGKLMTDISEAENDLAKKSSDLKQSQGVTSTVSLSAIMEGSGDTVTIDAAKAAEEAASAAETAATLHLKELKKKAVEFASQGVDLVTKISDEGFRRVNLGLKLAQEQAALSVKSAQLGYAAAAGLDTSTEEANVKRAELDIQNRLIRASYEAEMATIENTKTLRELTATQQILAAEALRAKAGTEPEKTANAKLADSMTEQANKILKASEAARALKGTLSPERTQELFGQGAKGKISVEKVTEVFGKDATRLGQAENKSGTIPAVQLAAKQAELKGKAEIISLDERNKKEEYAYKLELSALALTKEKLSLQLEQFNTYSALAPYMDKALVAEKESLQLASLQADIDTKAYTIAREREKIEENRSSVSDKTYKDQINLNNKKTENLYIEQDAKKLAIEINAIKEKGVGVQAKLAQDSAIELEKQRLKNSIEDARISNLQAELGFKQQLGLIDDKTANAKKAQYDTQVLTMRSAEEEAKIKADIKSKEEAIKTAEELIAAGKAAGSQETIDAAAKSQTAAEAALGLAKEQLTTLGQRTALQQTAIDQAKTYNDRLIEQKQHMEDLVGLTTSLGAIFGDVGTNIGNAVGAADALLKSQKDRKEALADTTLTEKQRDDLKTKFDKQEFSNTVALLGQTKKLFNEKSNGYKVIGAVEKAMHAWRIASMIKEGVVKAQETLASMGITSAASLAEAVAKIPATMMSFVSSMSPWVGIPAGLAFIASLGLGGSSHAALSFSPNSQQRQEVAGTGLTYDSQGNKVETGSGVFGDASAKSESIAKSMEILTTQGVEGLDYDKSLLKAFQKLSDSLTHAAEVIYAIPGLRMGGTDFGTQTGTSTTGAGGVIGGFMDSIGLGGVLGGQTTASSSIESAGIQLRGSLQDFIDGTKDSITKYKDVVTQFSKDGGWFGKDEQWSERHRELGQVSTEVQNALRDVFVNAKDVMTEIGGKVGTGVNTINDAFKHINFAGIQGDIDSMGLTGQAALDQLNAIIGQKLDETAKTIFPFFNQFKKFGEGFLQTVIRVQDGNNKVSQSLDAMGISAKIAGNYIASEYLIKIAGGLDKFRSQADFFTNTFLTDAQRLKPIQKGVTDQLAKLGLSSSLTKDQFVELVQAQDLNSVSGAELYQSLMDLAPGFNTVREAEAKALKAREDNWNNFFDKFASASDKSLKNASDITTVFNKFGLQIPKTKAEFFKLVETLRKSAPDTADAIINISNALSTYYTSADSFENVTISLSNSLKATSDTLKSQIKTLKDYNTALLLGSQSTLTTSDQYNVAKDQVSRLKSIIEGAANTPDEIKARNDAISSFSSASDTFLKLSSTLFGGSATYSEDFNLIRSTIQTTTSALESQLSDNEKQLNALTTANTFLEDIKNATKTTSDYLAAYLAAGGTALPKFAAGTNYVPYDMTAEIHKGERIVPAADNTLLMQNVTNNSAQTQELLNQIVNLTKQVEELAAVVADGAILNAKATDRNTQEITKVISNGNDKAIQSNRLQAKADIK